MTDEENTEATESKHGMDSAQKGVDADGSKQTDNPDIDEIEGTGGEGDDRGGLGDRTGAAGGAAPTEPGGDKDTAEKRK
jgi:hypothetical protein